MPRIWNGALPPRRSPGVGLSTKTELGKDDCIRSLHVNTRTHAHTQFTTRIINLTIHSFFRFIPSLESPSSLFSLFSHRRIGQQGSNLFQPRGDSILLGGQGKRKKKAKCTFSIYLQRCANVSCKCSSEGITVRRHLVNNYRFWVLHKRLSPHLRGWGFLKSTWGLSSSLLPSRGHLAHRHCILHLQYPSAWHGDCCLIRIQRCWQNQRGRPSLRRYYVLCCWLRPLWWHQILRVPLPDATCKAHVWEVSLSRTNSY